MKLRALLPLLAPAALLCLASGPAHAFDLGEFLTGKSAQAEAAQPQAAEPAAAEEKVPRHHRIHHAYRHVARHHPHPARHESEPDPAPSVAQATPVPAAAPAPVPAPPPARSASTAPAMVDGVRVVAPDEFNEIDAAADDAVNLAPPTDLEALMHAARPAPTTDGRGWSAPEAAAEPAPQPDPPAVAAAVGRPRLLALAIGGPLLIGFLAWPVVGRMRRTRVAAARRWAEFDRAAARF